MTEETYKYGDAPAQDVDLSGLVKEMATRLDKNTSELTEIRADIWDILRHVRELRTDVGVVNHWQKLVLRIVKSVDKKLEETAGCGEQSVTQAQHKVSEVQVGRKRLLIAWLNTAIPGDTGLR